MHANQTEPMIQYNDEYNNICSPRQDAMDAITYYSMILILKTIPYTQLEDPTITRKRKAVRMFYSSKVAHTPNAKVHTSLIIYETVQKQTDDLANRVEQLCPKTLVTYHKIDTIMMKNRPRYSCIIIMGSPIPEILKLDC